jgi:hypothetical protein
MVVNALPDEAIAPLAAFVHGHLPEVTGFSGPAGLDLRTGRPKPERLRQAVRDVLDDPRMRDRSREISEPLAAAGGASAAATLVEKLL